MTMPSQQEMSSPSQQEMSSKLGNERRIALVIGNSHYGYARELANPINDAEAMAAVLAGLGFDVVKGLDLEMHKMGDVQAAFGAKLRSKPDVSLLFYAGHGLQVKGINYLVPVDAQIEEPEHLYSRAIRFNDIFDSMTEGAGASLVFLDACRENPFTNLARSLGETARGSMGGGLAEVEKVAGSFIAFATAPDRVAFDGDALHRHSPFTAALLEHIEAPGLSVSDMMIDVRNSVLKETKDRQEPWDQSSLRARFYFVPKMEPKVEEAATRFSESEWGALVETPSLAVLASFKERHPYPPWREYADIRMNELRLTDALRRQGLKTYEQLRTGFERARAVGVIRTKAHGRIGTGFLVAAKDFIPSSEDNYLVMTAAHVFSDAPEDRAPAWPEDATIVFEAADKAKEYELTKIVWRSPVPRLDCALLRLSEQPQGIDPLPIDSGLPAKDGLEGVYVIGYAGGHDLAFSDGLLLDHEGPPDGHPPDPSVCRLHYSAPTAPGSGGSPVFSAKSWRVVALHRAAGTLPKLNGQAGLWAAREGIWIQSIRAACRAEASSKGTPADE